ncbi:MAG: hypothetical protein WCC59_15545 [Terriglobales bacterium]
MFVPAELAVTDEEPEKPNLPSGPPLPRTILLYRPRAVRRSSSVCITASSVFVRATRSGHQRSRSDTLPDAITALKSKTKMRCAEIVIVRDLLWMGLEIEGEIQKPQPQRTRRSQRKKKGRE